MSQRMQLKEQMEASEELAEKIASTDNISNVEKMKKETLEEMWRIDRVLLWKDIFIIVNDTKKVAREMKFNGNSAGFLYKYRNGKFDSLQVRSFNLEMHQVFLNGIYFKQTPLGKSGLVVKFGFLNKNSSEK